MLPGLPTEMPKSNFNIKIQSLSERLVHRPDFWVQFKKQRNIHVLQEQHEQ